MISVLIPCYNSSKTIIRALQSIFQTTFTDFEVILIDDGSTDGTVTAINKFIDTNQTSNVYVFQKENEGVVKAIEMAVERSRGDYLLCLDSDDYVDRDYLLTLSKEIEDYDVLAFGHKKVSLSGNILSEITAEPRSYQKKDMKLLLSKLYFDNNSFSAFKYVQIYRWSYLIKASIIRKILPVYKGMNLTLYEDLVYTMSAIAKADSVKIIDYAGLNYVQYPVSHSRNHQDSYENLMILRNNLRKFLEEYSKENDLDSSIFATMDFDVSKFYFSRYCLRHNKRESREFFKRLKNDKLYQGEKKLVSIKGESILRKIYFLLLKNDLFSPIYYYFRHSN